MTIEEMLGHSAQELSVMSDEELMAKFADVLKLEPSGPPPSEAKVKQLGKGEKPPKEKANKLSTFERLKKELEDLEAMKKQLS